MIGYLRGTISYLLADSCLIDVHGVGYRVFIAGSTRAKLAAGNQAQLFTYLNVREDAMQLYGFFSQAEYELFLQLISVSGIGPKVALGMMSAMTVESLCKAIHLKQAAVLVKLPGIGKKTAERLILELHDKMKTGGEAEGAAEFIEAEPAGDCLVEASQALASLGYGQAEYLPVLKKAPASLKTAECLIKFALKEFAGRG